MLGLKADRSYFRIPPQGQVTPCPYLPQAVGDLRRDKLAGIWSNATELQALRHTLPGARLCHERRPDGRGCEVRLRQGG